MSDLISRSALIESFRKCYSGYLGMEKSDSLMTFRSICKIINEQPTAYNVDAVVEEVLQVWDKLLYMCDMEDVDKVYDFRGCIENTIRKGGVNDK